MSRRGEPNQMFHQLTLVEPDESYLDGRERWVCRCSCGKVTSVLYKNLISHNTKSCGCRVSEVTTIRNQTHQLSNVPEYNIWNTMRNRCHNPNAVGYQRYGGRGIKVAPDWYRSFEVFYSDMGPRPSPEHSLDRRDNEGNYEPGN